MQAGENTRSLDDWRRFKSQVFWCYEGRPPLVSGFTRYQTANYSAWLIRRGAATLYSRGVTYQPRPGDWIIVPPPGYGRHFTEDVELLSVHFRFSWADELDLFTLTEPAIFPGAGHPALERAARRLLRLLQGFSAHQRFEPSAHKLTMSQYLHFQTRAGRFALTLMDALGAEGLLPPTRSRRSNPRLAPILARLRDLPLDRPWSSADTARSLSMSTGHFNRVFREEFGQTPRRYFDARRLELAKRGIVAGDVSIKEVAAGVGVSSAVFCRWFRQAVGTSPTHYRRTVEMLRTS